MSDETVTQEYAAAVLGVNVRTVQRKVQSGELASVEIGKGRRAVLLSALQDDLERAEHAADPETITLVGGATVQLPSRLPARRPATVPDTRQLGAELERVLEQAAAPALAEIERLGVELADTRRLEAQLLTTQRLAWQATHGTLLERRRAGKVLRDYLEAAVR